MPSHQLLITVELDKEISREAAEMIAVGLQEGLEGVPRVCRVTVVIAPPCVSDPSDTKDGEATEIILECQVEKKDASQVEDPYCATQVENLPCLGRVVYRCPDWNAVKPPPSPIKIEPLIRHRRTPATLCSDYISAMALQLDEILKSRPKEPVEPSAAYRDLSPDT